MKAFDPYLCPNCMAAGRVIPVGVAKNGGEISLLCPHHNVIEFVGDIEQLRLSRFRKSSMSSIVKEGGKLIKFTILNAGAASVKTKMRFNAIRDSLKKEGLDGVLSRLFPK